MKNLAIILGVWEYQNVQSLPGCKNDAKLMQQLLEATEKYTVLVLDGNEKKNQLLEKLETFLQTECIKEPDVNEILFYFSGHGCQDSEMHMALRYTELNQIQQTSLNNSEIDSIIRPYSPKLYVKIVDSCESGLRYIKALDETDGRVEVEQPPVLEKILDNCIFMCSSRSDQSSMASDIYSDFTKAFAEGVFQSLNQEKIRYSDIKNYIIDTFRNSSQQTPYFSTQEDGRGVFSEVTEKLK